MSLTLMMTASFPTPLRILYQIPGGKEKHSVGPAQPEAVRTPASRRAGPAWSSPRWSDVWNKQTF